MQLLEKIKFDLIQLWKEVTNANDQLVRGDRQFEDMINQKSNEEEK